MARAKGPHLVKPGSIVKVMGTDATATWCGTWSERDDVNHHALDKVKCPVCVRNYRKANPAT